MEANRDQRRMKKRLIHEIFDIDRPKKRPSGCVNIDVDDDEDGLEKIYKFQVLLPNGTSLGLKIRQPETEMPIEELTDLVRREYFGCRRQTESPKQKRRINWNSEDLCFIDAKENKIRKRINFKHFQTNKNHILRLHDGCGEADTYENMWDLTPDTELLKELPEEYTYETALADLIDNSLQAVWSNGANERRLVSVEINKDKISIFDTGPGMDDSEENCIVKWGKIGASLHRSSRGQAIGGTPPYLMPFFGMFGYGGPIASMHLGRCASVSSMTRESKKVYTLYLERDALLGSSGSEQTWRTKGGLRDPLQDEIQKSPHGSFTKVEILEPKMRSLDISQLHCKLKDIYFPYIQCDEVSSTGKTIMPVEFQVNGIDLAEVESGEVAITNLHACNGPNFVLQLHFHLNKDNAETKSPGLIASQEANARLKCVYFPIVEGKESIERILEKLEEEKCGIKENCESFSHVSIRRLGRLLPDARWAWLPFMEPRQRKGDRAQILKRCCLRVKCFIETDAGFYPTRSKTDLAHYHPYTIALKNFGNKPTEKEVHVEVYKDEKPLTLLQLERQYQEWILQMHQHYDEEIDTGEDEPVLVVTPSNKSRLCISLDVVRVHKVIRRKGTFWKSGQKLKVLKGACAGLNKNLYAILEYILLEGCQGEAGGEARLICRPLGVPEEKGCLLGVKGGNARLDIRESTSLPISVIDSGKCLAIETAEWNNQLEKQIPSSIDVLSVKQCQELEVKGALPLDAIVDAGHVPPKEIVAVVRPACFNSASASKNLVQKYIVKVNFEMSIEIKFRAEDKNMHTGDHIYSGRVTPSSRKGFHGLYIFPLRLPQLFKKAGVYTFSFSLRESSCKKCVKKVQVKALSDIGKWGLLSREQSAQCCVRVGSCFPSFSIACYDRYDNHIPFTSVPEVMVKISSKRGVLPLVHKMKMNISSDKLILRVQDLLIESDELDKFRPSYETTLKICSQDESFSVAIPCQVIPGSVQRVTAHTTFSKEKFLPGHVIKELVFEMFDAYGNHVREGEDILFNVDGFSFQDGRCPLCKVDDRGFVDLSGLLKVTKGYGKNVSLSVLSDGKVVFKKEFQTEKRELRDASGVPRFCAAGSQLENIVFEIINSEGDVDVSIHDDETCGQSHTLMLKSESMDTDDSVRYSFRHGRCIVRSITLPQKEGLFCFVAAHSRHPELHLTIEVHVEEAPKVVHKSIQSQCSDERILLLQDSSSFKSPKVDSDYVRHQLLVQDSPKDVENLVNYIMNDQKELDEGMFNYGVCIGQHEETLKRLRVQEKRIEQDMSKLQASMEPGFCRDLDYLPEKEVMMERIEGKSESAAAVVCKFLRAIPFQEQSNDFAENILGVVALLGLVQNNELSRILAEYLGEHHMLAVVCKSYAAAGKLEKYEQDGKVNRASGIYALAAEIGKSISGRYLTICIEDIRPYTGELDSDPQRMLALPEPILQNGKIPLGYLGYAVNMIHLDGHHLHTRTAAGHGLRETLFYRLFGELQVYETREYMKMAQSCIKEGAVSLDGGIMRGNGVICLGCWEPDIHFPVVTPERQKHFSQRSSEILMQIEEHKSKLRETRREIDKGTKAYNKVVKKFEKTKERYTMLVEKKETLLGGLEYRRNVDSSCSSPC